MEMSYQTYPMSNLYVAYISSKTGCDIRSAVNELRDKRFL